MGVEQYGALTRPEIERVQRPNAEILEISNIAGDDDQIMNRCGRGDHCVFDQVIRPAMHEARP